MTSSPLPETLKPEHRASDSGEETFRRSYLFGWITVLAACLIPAAVMAFFGHQPNALGGAAAPSQFLSPQHFPWPRLALHLMVGTAGMAVGMCVLLMAWIHYQSQGECSVMVLGLAIACAATMDLVHLAGAGQLLPLSTPWEGFLWSTWCLSRLLFSLLLVGGIYATGVDPAEPQRRRLSTLGSLLVTVSVSLFSGAGVYLISQHPWLTSNVQTLRWWTSAADLLTTGVFLLGAAWVFPRYWHSRPSPLAMMLWISVLPHVASDLYLWLGAKTVLDATFHAAGAMKLMAYSLPGLGLVMEHIGQLRREQEVREELQYYAAELEVTRITLEEQTYLLHEHRLQLERQNHALQEQATKLEESQRAAEAASQSKSEFLANTSHEIRTPLTAIIGYSEVLLDRLQDPENRRAVETIRRNGEFLLALINDILDLSKIEAGRLEVERIECYPVQLLQEVVELMRPRADSRNLKLQVELATPIPQRITTDPTRLRQVLVNLVGNAIKFTEIGSVTIRAALIQQEGQEPLLEFRVIDTGIGIPKQKLDTIFQPFSQADTSVTRKFGGTGLGLTISRRLTRMLGGDLTVESTPGKGSTFIVRVKTGPLEGVPMVDRLESASGAGQQDGEGDQKIDLRGARILVAEDGPDNQRLITFLLRKAGAEVELAENGQKAVEMVQAAQEQGTPYDLVLMDVQMPVMDGYTATGKLRQLGFQLPVIALTAHAMKGELQKAKQAGCNDHLAKPFRKQQLLQTVARHLNTAAHSSKQHSSKPAKSAVEAMDWCV